MITWYIIAFAAALIINSLVCRAFFKYGHLKGLNEKNTELYKRMNESSGKVIRLYWLLKELRKEYVNERQHNELLLKANVEKYKEGWKDCETYTRTQRIYVSPSGQIIRVS